MISTVGIVVAILFSTIIANFIMLSFCKRRVGIRNPNESDFSVLRGRLQAYAELSGNASLSVSPGIFTVGQHRILLGIIKKIEAKNAVMAAVVAILLGSGVAIVSSLPHSFTLFSQYLFFFIGIQAIFLITVFSDGAAHISNWTSVSLRRRELQGRCLAEEMQRNLASDLLLKEAKFNFCIVLLVCCLLGILMVFAAELLAELFS